MWLHTWLLLEGKTGVTVRLEDLFDRVDVCGRAEVQSEVVAHGGDHDGARRTLHRVVQPGVHDVLLRGTGDALLEGFGRFDRDLATDRAKPCLE